jgi:hypothetical protein
MVLSGALSTMNIWVEKIEDIRYSLNDLYMILLMSGWMFLFMGLYYKEMIPTFLGGVLAAGSFLAIRTQYGVSEADYVRGMIPHHSMAARKKRCSAPLLSCHYLKLEQSNLQGKLDCSNFR